MGDRLMTFVIRHPWWSSFLLFVASSLLFGWWLPTVGAVVWLIGSALIGLLRIGAKRQGLVQKRVPRIAPGEHYVHVVYQDLDRGEPSPGKKPYIFRWGLKRQPQVGDRVITDADSPAYVVAVDADPNSYRGHIADIARLASPGEIATAQRKVEEKDRAWLEYLRHAAGLPVRGRRLPALPEGAAIPCSEPPMGLSFDEADQGGRTWWRASRGAVSPEESARFEEIAHRWFAVRDQLERVQSNPAARVRDRHYTEWVETVKQMKRDGDHGEALQLLTECQDATIRADGAKPAPWWFEQAAIIHRKDGDLDAEHAVIERYFQACGDEPHKTMVERRQKVAERRAKVAR